MDEDKRKRHWPPVFGKVSRKINNIYQNFEKICIKIHLKSKELNLVCSKYPSI